MLSTGQHAMRTNADPEYGEFESKKEDRRLGGANGRDPVGTAEIESREIHTKA